MHRLSEPRGGYIKKSREADNKSKDSLSVEFRVQKTGCFFVGGPLVLFFLGPNLDE